MIPCICAVICAVIAIGISPCILYIAGFSAGGVLAGSFAAWIQSMIGNVAAGSIFAFLQGAGAAGCSFLFNCVMAIIGGIIGWLFGPNVAEYLGL